MTAVLAFMLPILTMAQADASLKSASGGVNQLTGGLLGQRRHRAVGR